MREMQNSIVCVCHLVLAVFTFTLIGLVGAHSQAKNEALTADQFLSRLAEDEHYPHRNWKKPVSGEGNFFLFLFRDLNRNGVYDLGDRPLPAIRVNLTMPSGQSEISRSNLNGFASFPASRLRQDAVIREPGRYRLQAILPTGWTSSTGNTIQFLELSDKEEAITGLIAERMPDPVGLVQDIYVTGKVKLEEQGTEPDLSITATRPDQPPIPISIDENGNYFQVLSPGDWKLEYTDKENETKLVRQISIKNAPVYISQVDLSAPEIQKQALQETLDFEGMTGSTLIELPSGVGGLRWHNMVATDFILYNGPGYMNNSISGHFVAYNSSGHPVTIWDDKPFDFGGGYFGVAWPEAHGETLIARAWSGDELVAEDRLPLSVLGPIWFDADYRSVDRVELSTEHYWQFVTDDMVVRTTQ